MASKKAVLRNKKKSTNNLKSANKPASQKQPLPEVKGNPGRKPTCKPGGRKATAKGRTTKPGVAGINLRNAINVAVASQSGRIAAALIEGTVQGSVGSAKLLIDLTGARNADESKKKRRGPSLPEILMREPQWQDPPDADPCAEIGAPFGRLQHEL